MSGRPPELWNFDWTADALFRELTTHHPIDAKDLEGRERRTALGSRIPGKPFLVTVSGAVRVQE